MSFYFINNYVGNACNSYELIDGDCTVIILWYNNNKYKKIILCQVSEINWSIKLWVNSY